MSCPTCDATMQMVVSLVWWCPRCGTIQKDQGEFAHVDAPRLVNRIDNFFKHVNAKDEHETGDLRAMAWSMGIVEAIKTPEER